MRSILIALSLLTLAPPAMAVNIIVPADRLSGECGGYYARGWDNLWPLERLVYVTQCKPQGWQ